MSTVLYTDRQVKLLAHLSQRLARWAYSIGLVKQMSTVSKKNIYMPWWKILFEFYVHHLLDGGKVALGFGTDGNITFASIWQKITPTHSQRIKLYQGTFSAIFHQIFFRLAGHKDMHKSLEESEILRDDFSCIQGNCHFWCHLHQTALNTGKV